jgi:Tol biopolymer transport system component/predicted Ser/Thr protein kinase
MPLSVGTRLCQYEILAPLGAGGMGEVYKARDSRLNRLAALKVLPPSKMADPDRRARFIQEAQAASALNHPHIVTIYGIDREADADFIAMEYIQGRTLEQAIGRRALKLQDLLRIGIEIADALTAAHAAGIVHRDLKPANVMIAESGSVKVLDFGLAKLTEAAELAGDEATRTIRADGPVTEKGVILGTVSYLSPEQAEGEPVDARSDIFSFGSVLYEMATGRRAFQGSTKISTISAILRDEPKPVSDLTAGGIPRDLEKIIMRCLRKDVARRFQHMDDVKVALEELKEEAESGKLTGLAMGTPAKRTPPFIWAGVLLALVLIAGFLFWRSRTPEKPATGPALTRLTSDVGLTMEPAFWAQGNLVAYASDRDGRNLEIYVQQLGGEPHRITNHEADDHEPDFSPDGTKIAFRSERDGGGIYIIPALGGTERKVADRGRYPKFSPDGKWIAYWDGEPGSVQELLGNIYVQAAAGGNARQLARRATPAVWSPDSKRLLYRTFVPGTTPRAPGKVDWFTIPVESGTAVPIGVADHLAAQNLEFTLPMAWTTEGVTFQAVAGESHNLWRLPISSDYKVKQPARQLTFGTNLEIQPAVSGNRMLFTEMTENADIWTIPADTDKAKIQGEPQQITRALTQDTGCSISADGSKVVYSSLRGSALDLVIRDLVNGNSMTLATLPMTSRTTHYVARITNDGGRVAFQAPPDRGTSVVPAAGGVVKRVCDLCLLRHWSADGRTLLIDSLELVDPETGQKQQLLELKQTGPWTSYVSAPRPSWDDRWITFYRNAIDGGRTQVTVVPVHPGRSAEVSEWIPITDGKTVDMLPEFSPDGSILYFFSQRDGARCLWVQRLDPTTKKPSGPAEPVYHFHSARRSPINNKSGQNAISVARNKIALQITERLGNIWMAEIH